MKNHYYIDSKDYDAIVLYRVIGRCNNKLVSSTEKAPALTNKKPVDELEAGLP